MPETLCCVCDSPDPSCGHEGARHLSEIVYERTPEGWKVPESERAIWEEMALRSHERVVYKPVVKELDALVTELDFWLFLSKATRNLLERAYEQNPTRITRLCEQVVLSASTGKLSMPDRYLDKRLREELS